MIPDFEEDIFISYSLSDNRPLAEGHAGWVNALHERLAMRLVQLLGEEPAIWRDPQLKDSDSFRNTLILKLSRTAVFVAVLSPRYVTSDWCLRELQEFSRSADQASGIEVDPKGRIFKVIKTPVEKDKEPSEVKDITAYEFYELDERSGRLREFSHESQFETFKNFIQAVDNLAYDIKMTMEQMREASAHSLEQEALRPLRVFLCHSSDDKPAVRSLYQRLRADSFEPWLDEENILPGEEWEGAIQKAVRSSDIVIVCLSHNSINKSGYLQKEIRFALDIADEQPPGTIFLIPAKLTECDVPERFNRWQWVNLYEDQVKGYERLVRALKFRASKLRTATGRDI